MVHGSAAILEYNDALLSVTPIACRETFRTWIHSLDHDTMIEPRIRGPLVRDALGPTYHAHHAHLKFARHQASIGFDQHSMSTSNGCDHE